MLERLVVEWHATGMSTRDVAGAFGDVTGELVILRTAVSEVTDEYWTLYKQFISRDLSGIAVENLFVDGLYESLRRHGAKGANLVVVSSVARRPQFQRRRPIIKGLGVGLETDPPPTREENKKTQENMIASS